MTFPSRRIGDDKNDTKYCNSIGCSNGYTPIENAHDVKCEDGKCEEKQCCETFCSYYACPNNYTPVYGADKILSEDSGCTTDVCCHKVRNATRNVLHLWSLYVVILTRTRKDELNTSVCREIKVSNHLHWPFCGPP